MSSEIVVGLLILVIMIAGCLQPDGGFEEGDPRSVIAETRLEGGIPTESGIAGNTIGGNIVEVNSRGQTARS